MFIYFALPMAFNDLRIDPFTAAVVTIMINSGAYIAEITRGAVLSIHKGFREAGLALGLSRWETIRYVILPLALRRMLPPLGNQWIISIKDTSLFIVIGVAELTRQGQEIIAGNFRALEDLERRGGVLSDYYHGAELYSASSGKKDENPVIEFKTSPSTLAQPVCCTISI